MNTRRQLLVLAVLVAVAPLLVWLWLRGAESADGGVGERERPAEGTAVETHASSSGLDDTLAVHDVPAPAARDIDAPAARGAAARVEFTGTKESQERPQDRPDESSHPGKVIPHPIDDARLVQAEQRRLFMDVDAALEANDYTRARSLLTQYDARFVDDEAWSDKREAYQLIADCQEHASPQARANGQRFVDEQRGSTMRRAVRRACLSGPRAP